VGEGVGDVAGDFVPSLICMKNATHEMHCLYCLRSWVSGRVGEESGERREFSNSNVQCSSQHASQSASLMTEA